MPRKLPAADTIFVFPDGRREDWISCAGEFGTLVYSLEIPDIDWVAGQGFGVAVDLSLGSGDDLELVQALRQVAEHGWATHSARWSIQQSGINWHGAGARSFADAILGWETRYRNLSSYHHSEELCYQDSCEGGFYTLNAQVATRRPRQVHHCYVSFQLSGIPADTSAFRQLFDSLEIDHPIYFRPRSEHSTIRHHLDERLTVQPEAFIVDVDRSGADDSELVIGLVVRNPYKQPDLRKSAAEWMPRSALHADTLICRLGSWHLLTSRKLTYHLRNFDWAWSSDMVVASPTADWDDPEPKGSDALMRPRIVRVRRQAS